MIRLIGILILGLFVYSSPVNLPKSVIKKMDKTIHKVWEDEVITYQTVLVSSAMLDSLEIELQENQLFIVKNESSVLGYVYLDQGMGRYDYFDYMILTDTSILVKQVQVLIYRSENGGAICNKRWLRQFKDFSPDSSFDYGKEVDAISGATLSGNSITEGVANGLKQLDKIKKAGIL